MGNDLLRVKLFAKIEINLSVIIALLIDINSKFKLFRRKVRYIWTRLVSVEAEYFNGIRADQPGLIKKTNGVSTE